MERERDYNLLALSDLHLGCELKLSAPFGAGRRAALDRALVEFLDTHAVRRESGKRWRLLLNGDIFDFVAVTAVPPGLNAPFEIKAEERLFGLAPEEAKSVWKLRRIAAAHEDVFHALARFLVAGNDVQLIRGNHDAELQFPSVQAELVRLLGRRTGIEGEALRALESRIQFHAWFYLEPGLLYLEHGNAHDSYCLQSGFFDDSLEANGELELPITSKVLRYFADRWAKNQEDLDGADQMNLLGYIAWIFRMGSPLRIALDYFAMVIRVLQPIVRKSLALLRSALSWKRQEQKARQVAEQERLARVQRWLARFEGASDQQARKLLAVAARPAEQSLFACAQLFYVDRILLTAVALAALIPLLVVARGFDKLIWSGAIAALFLIGNHVLASRRRCDAHLLLRAAAERLAPIFGVRYVVMGHSHRQVDEPLAGAARYLNLGSWSPGSQGLPHLALIGERAEMRSFVGKPLLRPETSGVREPLVAQVA